MYIYIYTYILDRIFVKAFNGDSDIDTTIVIAITDR